MIAAVKIFRGPNKLSGRIVDDDAACAAALLAQMTKMGKSRM